MTLLKTLCTVAVLTCTQAHAEAPRLSLSITDAIGATNASQCALPGISMHLRPKLWQEKTTYQLTDTDIASWDPATAVWTLHRTGVPANDSARRVVDHCFVLQVDGAPIASGVALSTYSARLVSMPVLGVSVKGDTMSFRLGANTASESSVPVLHDRIGKALEGKPRSAGTAQ